MADNVENIVIEILRRMQSELSAIRESNREIVSRLGSIEQGISRIARDRADDYGDVMQNRRRIDGLQERVERIERRLDLVQ